ncbi:hypothetical protein [Parasitella parasitica]|uniref:Reverse transcriptase zinc-binding domain-containing protein n=1 Tax=Parasitella parasitica TaxID=35722 RepID=A0A0B7NTQ5_9FUNG|nr:hypothetical protein [Parasitella parasitica]
MSSVLETRKRRLIAIEEKEQTPSQQVQSNQPNQPNQPAIPARTGPGRPIKTIEVTLEASKSSAIVTISLVDENEANKGKALSSSTTLAQMQATASRNKLGKHVKVEIPNGTSSTDQYRENKASKSLLNRRKHNITYDEFNADPERDAHCTLRESYRPADLCTALKSLWKKTNVRELLTISARTTFSSWTSFETYAPSLPPLSMSRSTLSSVEISWSPQSRALDPLLFERPYAPAVSNYVHLHVLNHMNTTVLDMGLLFPACSSTSVGVPLNIATMIFRTMDTISCTILPADRNPIECLLLPIPVIIESSPEYKLSSRLKSTTVGDIFELQASGLILTPISGNQLLRLESFLLLLYNQDDRPQIQAVLSFASFHKENEELPTDGILQATERRLPRPQRITAASWNAFWTLLFNHTQRNVIYRMIHRKILTRLTRSYWNSSIDPHCTSCLTVAESMDHFFLYCEVNSIFGTDSFFWSNTSMDLVKQSVHTLNFIHYASFQRALAKRQVPSSAG